MTNLPDVQCTEPTISIPINQVGVKNLDIPFLLYSKYNNRVFEIITSTDVMCSLGSDKKGISMSRCIRTLKQYINKQLNQNTIKKILFDFKDILESDNIYMKHRFKFPIFRKSVVSDNVFPVCLL